MVALRSLLSPVESDNKAMGEYDNDLYILQIAIRLSDFHRQIMAPYSQTSEYCLVPFPPQNQHSHYVVKNNP